MSLTPATIRQDRFLGNKKLNCGPGSKPCGGACIPKDKKCRASWNKPVKLAAGVAGGAVLGLVATGLFHKNPKMRKAAWGTMEPAMQGGFALGNIARGSHGAAAKNLANAAMASQELGANLRTLGTGYKKGAQGLYNRGRETAFKWKNHRRAKGRKDSSIWMIEPREDAAKGSGKGKPCGASHIPSTHQCAKGAGVVSGVTKGLDKGKTKDLISHRNTLWDEQVKRYGKPINNLNDLDQFQAWSRKQPDRAEIDEINKILRRRRERKQKIGTTAAGAALTAGILGAGVLAHGAINRRR